MLFIYSIFFEVFNKISKILLPPFNFRILNIGLVGSFLNKVLVWLGSVNFLDHKLIGLSYLLFGVLGGVIGSYVSLVIRLELLLPGYYVLSGSSSTYNALITSHGFLMIFFAAMPVFINGFGNFLIPIMLGVRDMAFPRINLFSLLLFILSLFLFLVSFGIIPSYLGGAGFGWTLVPPLSVVSSSSSLLFLVLALHINGISSLLNSINTIVTIQYCSCISKWHSSLFSWSLLITSYLLVLVLPVLVVGVSLLITDKFLLTCFFSSSGGGDPVLYQHLFWFFGHPEVYILILPVFGLVSEFLSEYSGSVLMGYKVMVWSMVCIAVLGCLVWAHHLYTLGIEVNSKFYFVIASSLIGVPTGLKILIWLATAVKVGVRFNIVNTFIVLFITTFVFGGLTGIWLAQAGFDLMLHDTYFVVAHFHYVLAVSLIYIFFASVYNYFNLVMGYSFNKEFARVHLITFAIGSNILFLPMHFLGLSGMPRRVFDYPACFIFLNNISTTGLIIINISFFWFMLSLTNTSVVYNILDIISRLLKKILVVSIGIYRWKR